MNYFDSIINTICNFFHSIPETLVNIGPQAIVSYLCLNLAITPVFIACQTQLMLSVFSVLFFFINIALILILVGLEYLGLAVLLVYAGAIIMILLFIIMLVKLQETESQPFHSLSPVKWTPGVLTLHGHHVKARSVFLITSMIVGAALLTYSCKSLIEEILPSSASTFAVSEPSMALYSWYANLAGYSLTEVYAQPLEIKYPYQPPMFDTELVSDEPNYIPWLFTYFNQLLETKFQPIVFEQGEGNLWDYMLLDMAPSYNLDRWTLNLVEQFGRLNGILPSYPWMNDLIAIEHIPSSGNHPLAHVQQLVHGDLATKSWDFYPRTRPWVFDYPSLPMDKLLANNDIPLIYATECEFKDQVRFPLKDISNISSSLYTKYAPTLVLASICLFVAMVLSFFLTDFKARQ